MAKDKKKGNKKGIQFQIQTKIDGAIVGVMLIIAILVIVVVYNLLINSNNTELQLDSEAVSLQVEKYFAPFERMVEQIALDDDVKEILTTTGAGERMNECTKTGKNNADKDLCCSKYRKNNFKCSYTGL